MPDVPDIPRPSLLWKRLSAERKLLAADAFWQDENAAAEQAEAVVMIAQRIKFRTRSVQTLPRDKKSRHLVNLGAPGPKDGSTSCNQAGSCDLVFSYLMFRDLEREQKVFSGIAAHRIFGANVGYHGQTLTG